MRLYKNEENGPAYHCQYTSEESSIDACGMACGRVALLNVRRAISIGRMYVYFGFHCKSCGSSRPVVCFSFLSLVRRRGLGTRTRKLYRTPGGGPVCRFRGIFCANFLSMRFFKARQGVGQVGP